MSEKIFLKDWKKENEDRIKLIYSDDEVVYVSKKDFDRAFGTIISGDKDTIKKDYSSIML